MSLLDVPLRLFMWMLHAFTRWAFEEEIVYVNVTWNIRCACEYMRDCLCKWYMMCLWGFMIVYVKMLHAFTRDVPLRCEIVYVNVTCIYEMSLWGWEIVYVNVTWIIRCACEYMRDCLCKCYMSLLDVPLRMGDCCLCKCCMHLIDARLRLFM
jgi:hypothetical protein